MALRGKHDGRLETGPTAAGSGLLGVLFEEADEVGVEDLAVMVDADLNLIGFAGPGDDFAFAAQTRDAAEGETAGGAEQCQVEASPAFGLQRGPRLFRPGPIEV